MSMPGPKEARFAGGCPDRGFWLRVAAPRGLQARGLNRSSVADHETIVVQRPRRASGAVLASAPVAMLEGPGAESRLRGTEKSDLHTKSNLTVTYQIDLNIRLIGPDG
jgi:hypothetical protein